MKLLFLDTETTGTYPSKNAILQVGGIVRIDGKIKKKFNIKIKPHEGASIDFNAEMAEKHRLKSSTGFNKFKDILEKFVNPYDKKDKFYMLAYNSKFDEGFIRSWFLRNDCRWYGSYFWNPSVDVMQLAMRVLMKRNKRDQLENMKLGTVAKYFGIHIEENKLHDAVYDAKILKDLYNKLVKKYKI